MVARDYETIVRELRADVEMLKKRQVGGGGGGGMQRNIGEEYLWNGAFPIPADALELNGQAVSRTGYPELFFKWGTTYGVGDGSTTFNVPNLPSIQHTLGDAFRPTAVTNLLTTSYVDVSSLTVTGYSDGSEVALDWGLWMQNAGSGANRIAQVRVLCDGVVVDEWVQVRVMSAGGDERFPFSGTTKHTPVAGIHTWKVQALCQSASSVAVYNGGSLTVGEKPSQRRVVHAKKLPGSGQAAGGGAGYLLGAYYPWGAATDPTWGLELNGQTIVNGKTTYSGIAAIYPSWISGNDLVLPDLRETTLVHKKTGGTFGTLGAKVGAESHVHGSSGMIAGIWLNAWKTRSGASWTATNTGGLTAPAGSAAVNTAGPSIEGNTDAASTVQPSTVVRYFVCVVSSAGEFDTQVQTALVSSVATLQSNRRILQGVIPSSIAVTAGTAGCYDDGTIWFNNVGALSLNDIFDGLGSDMYQFFYSAVATVNNSNIVSRFRAAGVDYSLASGYGSMYGGVVSAAGSFGSSTALNFMYFAYGSVGIGTASGLISRPKQVGYKSLKTDTFAANYVEYQMGNYSPTCPASDGLTIFNATGGTQTGFLKIVKL